MKTCHLIPVLFLVLFSFYQNSASAQTGDQILDGIGETGIVARYIFKGDLKDWTRNNLHAGIQGSEVKFIDDELFGKVLLLPGDSKSYISIPGEAFTDMESVSITGWIYLNSPVNDQQFFGHDFTITPYRWNHFAIVLDITSKTTSTYLNGKLNTEKTSSGINTPEIFNGNIDLNARLHDFRIYRIALNEGQITTILRNSFRGQSSGVRTRRERDSNLPVFSDSIPQLYTAYLDGVPDIEVETFVGNLPRLPRFIPGIYNTESDGPAVRVIWPAPVDNSKVLKPGSYTVTGHVAGTGFEPKAIVKVIDGPPPPTPGRSLEVFDLDQVTLNMDIHGRKTKFIENRDKFLKGLSNTNPDNFLYMFRNAFGQEQPDGAEPLGGWDSQETKLRGHATGHYMSAIAQAYASTFYDTLFRTSFAGKMDYMVNSLYELSQLSGKPQTLDGEHVSDPLLVPPGPGKTGFESDLSVEGIRTDYWNWGKGFISAYPPDQFIMLENGARYGGDNSKVWAPYYTLHKILAGLMDIYEVSGNEKALDIVKGMGNWVYKRLSQVPAETLISMWNRYIAGEFGGMNEAMARLYRLTGESRYLETAHLFDNIRVFYGDAYHSHGLAKNVDMFRGLHANQHIPQIMGALEIYRDSEDPDYYHIADNFWNMVTNDYMYSIGGVAGARNPSNAECFTSEPSTLYENGFSAGGQNETCCTYNMLKLTRNLFLFDHRAELMDYYERGLYNHILASVDENTSANTYHVPLRAGSVKHFGNAEMNGFSCCNGTALESSTKLQNTIYFKSADNNALYVNLFIPSTLNWIEKNIVLSQSTAFPKDDITSLSIKGNGKFDLKIRVPRWATKGFYIRINGKEEETDAVPGSYLTLSRKWKYGDTIEIQMPFSFHLEPVMDQQNIASLFYGPVLLAAQESEPRKEWRRLTLDAKDLGKSISGNPDELEFTIDGVLFKPFYETYGRYSVYLDVILK